MSRGIGEFDGIQGAIPDWLAIGIALLTQLGDIWFIALLLGGLYWWQVAPRADIATVAGVWLAGIGLYRGLKEVFAFPRPNELLLDPAELPIVVQQVYESTAFATGYGFPSGHAVGTTIVYFGLAHVLPIRTRRRRFVIAGGLVAAVSVSRVALGLHYVVDVVAGVGVGLVLLVTVQALISRSQLDQVIVAGLVAIGFGVFYVVTSAGAPAAILTLTITVAAVAGWRWLDSG
ncbi:phosphatase PAP2 family protein [Salinadaptatus halalkaliphilus]|uniref:Phosphatase PAP2 family protein n=1 Tax=Salinadaptatus halalkaliphilus TaxID=2419781 RepID=A0A4S3TKS4_9EURY|nr:phosphatase PAP2 family protein [Salinadaptatus halalkaliphilus]THE64744.1 phosphatase PAP2 family protein [Salinadaptatus halalkaliphilus]